MSQIATILVEVPLSGDTGSRAVTLSPDGVLRVFKRAGSEEEQIPQHSFTPGQALAFARGVLAGDQRTMTAPETLRVLAAALLALDHQCGLQGSQP